MGRHIFERQQVIDLPLREVFDFFSSAANLQRVTPARLRFEFVEPPPSEVTIGTRISYRLRINRVPVRWVTRISGWEPPHRFADDQETGPYAYWHHVHSFEEIERGRTLMSDRVEYEVPFGPLGEVARVLFVDAQLRSIFAYRRRAFAALREGRPGS
ncbi:MAG: SRPBCC family protein [Candidatus Dormibacteria bacterium]